MTKLKTGLFILVLAAVAGLWWASTSPGKGGRGDDGTTVQFEGKWVVFSHDVRQEMRSDSGHVVWHAAGKIYNQVHYGGKYQGAWMLPKGTHVVTLRIEVDATTETSCKVIVGSGPNQGKRRSLSNRSSTGVCAITTTVVVP